jgi:protein-ribulosamine 3-kinase
MSDAIHDLLKEGRTGNLIVEGGFPLDENVVAAFPPGSKILSATRYGTSAWTITARLKLQMPDNTEDRFFLKVAAEEAGRKLMEGEFNAMSELYKWAPDFVPKPHSWGKYKVGNPDTYFFLAQYVDMAGRVPDPNQLCRKLAQLHRVSTSPNGQFGFHVTTCQGKTAQCVDWQPKWTDFFNTLLQHVCKIDYEVNGDWEDFATLQKRIFDQVIPRLIGNLERDGRSINPCLIHADLWEGNVGTAYETGDIYIFDSGAFYAHNEMEIGDWRCHYNKIHNRIFTKTYLKHYPPSEPKEEWDDRNRMYCIYYNVIYSCNHMSQGKAVRQM